eukprot:8320060-Heterocapsa_arctica.AAC.1
MYATHQRSFATTSDSRIRPTIKSRPRSETLVLMLRGQTQVSKRVNKARNLSCTLTGPGSFPWRRHAYGRWRRLPLCCTEASGQLGQNCTGPLDHVPPR